MHDRPGPRPVIVQPIHVPDDGRAELHSLASEAAVLGICLLESSRLGTFALDEIDFYSPRHRTIYGAMRCMEAEGRTIGAEEVEAALHERHPEIGLTVLVGLCDAVIESTSLARHVEIVRGKAVARRAHDLATAAARAIASDPSEAAAVVARLRAELDEIQERQAQARAATMPVVRLADMPEPGPTEWLIQGLWTRNAFGIVGALPKSYKSFFTLQMAVSVSTGRSLFGRYPVPREAMGRALIFNAEGGTRAIRRRLGAMCRALEVPIGDVDIEAIDIGVLRLDDPAQWARLVATVEDRRPSLLILDPMRELHGLDENDSAVAASLLGPLRALGLRLSCSVVVVHHMAKPPAQKGGNARRLAEQLRGSGAYAGAIDCGLFLAASGGEGADKRVAVEVMHRDAQGTDPFDLRLLVVPERIAADVPGEGVCLEIAPEEEGEEGAEEMDEREDGRAKILRVVSMASARGRAPLRTKSAVIAAAKVRKGQGLAWVDELLQERAIALSPHGYVPRGWEEAAWLSEV